METILGLLFLFFVLVPLGVVGLIIYLIVRRRSRLRKDQILERWGVLIENGRGSADEIYDSVVAALESAEPPGVDWEYQEIQAGGVLTGKSYYGLVVTNRLLRDYKIHIFAYNYGTSLHVAWFLSMQVGLLRRLLAVGVLKETDPRALVHYLDIPQELEVSAYVSTVHTATKRGVQALMEKLEQDFSKVDTRSKGFLEVW